MKKKNKTTSENKDVIFKRLVRRCLEVICLVLFLTMIGTTGYILIEKAPFIDAFYMTVITLASVGYREVIPLSVAGRLWTIFLIFWGISCVSAWVAIIATFLVESDFSFTEYFFKRKK